MAYSLLYGERPTVAAAVSAPGPLGALKAWLARARTRRTQRLALSNLLELDAALLDDLGIDRQAVMAAMANPDVSAGRALAARRARAASDWLHRP